MASELLSINVDWRLSAACELAPSIFHVLFRVYSQPKARVYIFPWQHAWLSYVAQFFRETGSGDIFGGIHMLIQLRLKMGENIRVIVGHSLQLVGIILQTIELRLLSARIFVLAPDGGVIPLWSSTRDMLSDSRP
ncbi:MAG TPA: hypothetical protein VHX20_08635 [Terracidiphilus sp.]|nr:hypothetical protein [Terracidiphilus sp.]